MAKTRCIICHLDATLEPTTQSDFSRQVARAYLITCDRCGQYTAEQYWTGTPPDFRDDAPFVSAATRQASERGLPLTLKSFIQTQELIELHRGSTVSQKIDKLMRTIAERCRRPGQSTALNAAIDYPLADCQDVNEFGIYLSYLIDQQLIVRQHGSEYAPSIAGWQRIQPSFAPGGTPGRCFVAMWFDVSMQDAYDRGFDPGVKDAGFAPIRIDQKLTNKGISDEIKAEIRLAQFTVADFTGQRQSVYYEAGFANGLGREVIWCCRDDHVANLHFDIRHLGHVVWKDPADLRKKLAESIQANIIPKR